MYTTVYWSHTGLGTLTKRNKNKTKKLLLMLITVMKHGGQVWKGWRDVTLTGPGKHHRSLKIFRISARSIGQRWTNASHQHTTKLPNTVLQVLSRVFIRLKSVLGRGVCTEAEEFIPRLQRRDWHSEVIEYEVKHACTAQPLTFFSSPVWLE